MYSFGSMVSFFRASCFGYFGFHSKGCLSDTPLLILLDNYALKKYLFNNGLHDQSSTFDDGMGWGLK